VESGVTSNRLALYIEQFEASEELTATARKLSERDRDYFDEKQLTEAEKKEMERRGQPVIISNHIKRKVNAMLGLERQTRKDPKAFPRMPGDEKAAEAVTDAVRYVVDDCRWDDKRSQAGKELAIEGTGAIFVGFKQARGGIDPDIRRVAWDRYYYDPHASEFDFSDKNYDGVVIWMDLDKAVAKWPEARDILQSTWASEARSDTYDDRPKTGIWADYKRRRIRICEHYHLGDEGWTYCLFTKAGFVVDPQPSPYLDEDGQPESPIKAVSLYVDRDNNRYGEVRTMIGTQDSINKRESKALHLINQRQVRVSPNVEQDPAKVRKELSRPDGVFIGEKDEVEILPTNDMAAGNLQMLQMAKADFQSIGPNAALGGKNEQALSGRAVMAQQQGGLVEMATYLDCIRTLSLAVYRSVWARIRQAWTAERWIRVTDNENNLRFVGLNKPITAVEAMAQEMGVTRENVQQVAAENPQAMQQLQMLAASPQGRQIVGVENAVAELDVDIILDEGIDNPLVAGEQFEEIVKMIPAMGAIGQHPKVLEMVVRASQLREKDTLIELLQQAQAQGPSPEQQQATQIALAGEAAKVEETQSKTAKNYASAEATQAGMVTDALQAGQQAGMAA
jgi:hypothetical protein